jgi:hypothetical protein
MTIKLPTTKQTRRMFTAAMKHYEVEIVKSKTREKANLSGIDYDLWENIFRNTELKNKLRTVEFHVRYDNFDSLTSAMYEFESMLTLSGKYYDTRRSWKYRYGSNHKIIKILSIIE